MRRILKSSCLAALLFLVACGTSPEPAFYTLAAVPGPVTTRISDTLKVVQPDLPQFLDRPDFVDQSSRYQISINETANWAEPLASMFERTLAEDLQARLPMAVVITDADDNPASTTPRYIIETKLQAFNAAKNTAVLKGYVQLTDIKAGAPPQHMPVCLVINNGSQEPGAVAQALSTLVGQYADQIIGLVTYSQR